MIRTGTEGDARRIHRLITANLAEGHLLPRSLPDVAQHAERFVVVTVGGRIVGCAELAPLSPSVAEVRSLVVAEARRGQGVGRRMVNELRAHAVRRGFEQICAFTHEPAYFERLGFSVVPHVSIPEKIAKDCHQCALVGRCGQFAMVSDLALPSHDGPSINALRV
ncbi:MAG: GNAT family N-acetyltransferase [Acidobacteria bacterium]|nr:GNAT family N-acetyltransferase [Acidobacteriota bacterium]